MDEIKNEIKRDCQQNEYDLPKLFLILAFITFFFPDNQRMLSWGYLKYIINVEQMNKVSWPLSIHHSFMKSLKFFHKAPRNMSGCSMLLLVSNFFF